MKRCTFIVTRCDDASIVKMILDGDNTFGAMGSGGYAIHQEKELEGVTVIIFRELDCAPARTFPAFIKSGNLWATYISGFVMSTLGRNGINFTCEQVDTPSFVAEYLARKLTKTS